MQVANPDYKLYRQLAGTWKNAEETTKIVLTDTAGITVTYNGTVLDGNYGVCPVTPSCWPGIQDTNALMLGAMGMMGQQANFHTGENIKLRLGNRALKNGEQALFFIDDLWHDLDDKLHLALKDLFTGEITDLILSRNDEASSPVLKEGEVLCQCGQVFSSRFCPNCGLPRNS